MEYEVVDEYQRAADSSISTASTPVRSTRSPGQRRISELKAWAARNEYSIYLVLCYYMVRAMQSVEDFRYRLLDGRVVLYDRLAHRGDPADAGWAVRLRPLRLPRGCLGVHASGGRRRGPKIRVDGVLRPDDRPNRILFTSASRCAVHLDEPCAAARPRRRASQCRFRPALPWRVTR